MQWINSYRKTLRPSSSAFEGWEVTASGEANYDEAKSTLVVELKSDVRRVSKSRELSRLLSWLPAPTVLSRRIPRQAARRAAREIFERWTRKIARSIPKALLGAS